MKKILYLYVIVFVFITVSYSQFREEVTSYQTSATVEEKKLTDEKMLSMLDVALKNLPEKVKSIPNNIRRVTFYSLKADRTQVSQPLLKQIQGKIEAAFASASPSVTLVYSPEIKPIRIVAKDDTITFTSGFQSTEEIKTIAQKLRLDGLLEGEIYYTFQTVYLNLRIFDTETMSIVWSCELNNIPPPLPTPPPKQKMLWYDIGIGGMITPIESLLSDSSPKTASYYSIDLRILVQTLFEKKLKFSVSAGTFYLYEGIQSSTKTIVSSSQRSSGPSNPFVRIGAKLSLIQKESIIPEVGKRDLLSLELTAGNIFASSKEIINIPFYSLKFESDITKEISISAGISYVSPTKIPEVGVKTGGVSYEISFIRFILNP